MVKYTTLFIDADGTIFDYDLAERKALLSSMPAVPETDRDDIISIYRGINRSFWLEFEKGNITVELLRRERFRKLVHELNLEIDPKALASRYLDTLGTSGDLIEGAIETLDVLKGRFTLLLLTNGFSRTQRGRIDASRIEGYFDHIVISEEVGWRKPEPQIFDHARSVCGNPPIEEILMIGDSLSSDIKGGNDYGIATCWLNRARTEGDPEIVPTYEISHVHEIKSILM